MGMFFQDWEGYDLDEGEGVGFQLGLLEGRTEIGGGGATAN